jgi:hypothetical protein
MLNSLRRRDAVTETTPMRTKTTAAKVIAALEREIIQLRWLRWFSPEGVEEEGRRVVSSEGMVSYTCQELKQKEDNVR